MPCAGSAIRSSPSGSSCGTPRPPPPARLGTAVGWFWFAFSGGLPTLGSLLASVAVPRVGPYATLWLSLGLVLVGGLIALLGVREPTGRRRLAPPGEDPLATLLSGVTIAW